MAQKKPTAPKSKATAKSTRAGATAPRTRAVAKPAAAPKSKVATAKVKPSVAKSAPSVKSKAAPAPGPAVVRPAKPAPTVVSAAPKAPPVKPVAATKVAPAPAAAGKVPLKPALAKVIAAKQPIIAKPAAAASRPVVPPPARPVVGAARTVQVAVGKPGAQRITAPVAPAARPAGAPAPQPATPKQVAQRAAAARGQAAAAAAAAAAKKPVSQRHGFKTNEFVVYPAHGVGRIVGIEEQEIAGMSLELFVITFEKDKMTLRVPTGKLQSVGMRKLAEEPTVKKAMDTLKGRARIKRTMWSRRAQEYEMKINSGDLVSVAEVVRDLYRSEQQPEQSYSERQLYELALDRMSRELAAVEKLDERGAVQRITEVLEKSARGRRAAEESAQAAGEGAATKAA
jgi:CarD family transcriptional regulator